MRVREIQKSAIGRILRVKRESLGISQETLAERAEVDRSYVSILERGLKSPTLETLEKVCRARRQARHICRTQTKIIFSPIGAT